MPLEPHHKLQIAMLMGNAICKFLQPSIYESIIRIKKYPYLPDLPPSRISVHTVKVEQLMVCDVIYITKDMTYREMKEILQIAPHLRSFPIVTDHENKILLGSVAKRYLMMLLRRHVLITQQDSRASGRMTPSEIFNTIRRTTVPLQAVFTRPTSAELSTVRLPSDLLTSQLQHDERDPEALLSRTIDLDEIAIDAAPFQLVLGSSLYKVHTLFSLLGLSHAYVTDCGRLVGVVGLKEVCPLIRAHRFTQCIPQCSLQLRDALANIYVRGAVVPERKLTSASAALLHSKVCTQTLQIKLNTVLAVSLTLLKSN
ncbi:unnamed protein product [Heligmosomoides polygyrus]|uniref:CBS domain-containing protein n=1 Tax=Heligmosomoides polygyrus TaxID=6339 RepID=A0A183GMG0_HELPZ|nr:unnamed protein product [Heligmosomoides polygyrus]